MSDRIYYSQEARERAMRKRSALAAIAIFIGAGIGATLALLFAPTEGEELRENIKSQATDTVDKGIHTGQSIADATMKKIDERFNELRSFIEDKLPS